MFILQVKYSECINYLMFRLFSAIIAFLFLSCSGTFFFPVILRLDRSILKRDNRNCRQIARSSRAIAERGKCQKMILLFHPVMLRLDRGISIHLSHPPSIASPARCGLTGASGGMEAEQPLIFTDLNIPVNMHRQNNAERCHNRQHNRSAVRNQRQRNADHRNKPENH